MQHLGLDFGPRTGTSNAAPLRIRMDGSKAMALLGFSTSRMVEETTMGEIQAAFMLKIHAIENRPAHDSRTKQSRRDELRRVNEAYQFLRKKQKSFSGRSMQQNWQVVGGKGKIVNQVIAIKDQAAAGGGAGAQAKPAGSIASILALSKSQKAKGDSKASTPLPRGSKLLSPFDNETTKLEIETSKVDGYDDKDSPNPDESPEMADLDGGDAKSLAESMSSCSIPDLSGGDESLSDAADNCDNENGDEVQESFAKEILENDHKDTDAKEELPEEPKVAPAIPEIAETVKPATPAVAGNTGAISKAFTNTVWEKAVRDSDTTSAFHPPPNVKTKPISQKSEQPKSSRRRRERSKSTSKAPTTASTRSRSKSTVRKQRDESIKPNAKLPLPVADSTTSKGSPSSLESSCEQGSNNSSNNNNLEHNGATSKQSTRSKKKSSSSSNNHQTPKKRHTSNSNSNNDGESVTSSERNRGFNKKSTSSSSSSTVAPIKTVPISFTRKAMASTSSDTTLDGGEGAKLVSISSGKKRSNAKTASAKKTQNRRSTLQPKNEAELSNINKLESSLLLLPSSTSTTTSSFTPTLDGLRKAFSNMDITRLDQSGKEREEEREARHSKKREKGSKKKARGGGFRSSESILPN